MKKSPLWFLIGVVLLTSCNLPTSPAGDTIVWFDVPLSGLTVPVNSPVHIEGHATSSAGVSRVDIWVNDELFTSIDNLSVKGSLANYETNWTPANPGKYTLSVAAVSKNGLISQTDNTTINVTGDGQKITISVSAQVVISRTVTITPEISFPPTTSPTVTPSITHTKPPPPTNTPTHTPLPPPPPDSQAPPLPGGFSPNGTKLPCVGSVALKWASVSDPSGISGYKLEIARSSNGKTWKAHPTSPMAGATNNSFTINVECGWHYRWRVLAIDGKGNQSPFSNWAQFSVVLN